MAKSTDLVSNPLIGDPVTDRSPAPGPPASPARIEELKLARLEREKLTGREANDNRPLGDIVIAEDTAEFYSHERMALLDTEDYAIAGSGYPIAIVPISTLCFTAKRYAVNIDPLDDRLEFEKIQRAMRFSEHCPAVLKISAASFLLALCKDVATSANSIDWSESWSLLLDNMSYYARNSGPGFAAHKLYDCAFIHDYDIGKLVGDFRSSQAKSSSKLKRKHGDLSKERDSVEDVLSDLREKPELVVPHLDSLKELFSRVALAKHAAAFGKTVGDVSAVDVNAWFEKHVGFELGDERLLAVCDAINYLKEVWGMAIYLYPTPDLSEGASSEERSAASELIKSHKEGLKCTVTARPMNDTLGAPICFGLRASGGKRSSLGIPTEVPLLALE